MCLDEEEDSLKTTIKQACSKDNQKKKQTTITDN